MTLILIVLSCATLSANKVISIFDLYLTDAVDERTVYFYNAEKLSEALVLEQDHHTFDLTESQIVKIDEGCGGYYSYELSCCEFDHPRSCGRCMRLMVVKRHGSDFSWTMYEVRPGVPLTIKVSSFDLEVATTDPSDADALCAFYQPPRLPQTSSDERYVITQY